MKFFTKILRRKPKSKTKGKTFKKEKDRQAYQAKRQKAHDKFVKKNMINSKVPKGFKKYFNIKDMLRPWARLYMIIMKRNVGKTHSVLMLFFEDWWSKMLGFAIVRRTKTEMDEFKKDSDDFFKEYGFQRVGNVIYDISDPDNKVIAGKLVTISQGYASASTKFDNVWNVLFDEFIAHNGVYVKWEFRIFANLVKSLIRFRKGRLFMMSNPVDSDNPYTTKFGFLNKKEEYNEEKRIVFKHFDDDDAEAFFTPKDPDDIAFILAMHDPSTMAMMYEGKWARNRSSNIKPIADFKNGLAPEYRVQLKENEIIVLIDEKGNYVFAFDDGIEYNLDTYALTTKDAMDYGNSNVPRNYERFIGQWLTAIKHKEAYFTSFEVRDIIMEYIATIKGARL